MASRGLPITTDRSGTRTHAFATPSEPTRRPLYRFPYSSWWRKKRHFHAQGMRLRFSFGPSLAEIRRRRFQVSVTGLRDKGRRREWVEEGEMESKQGGRTHPFILLLFCPSLPYFLCLALFLFGSLHPRLYTVITPLVHYFNTLCDPITTQTDNVINSPPSVPTARKEKARQLITVYFFPVILLHFYGLMRI